MTGNGRPALTARRCRLWGACLVTLALGSAPCFSAPKTDVVVLINGNEINGEVKRLERGILSYSTDYMGTLSIEWDKVAQLRSTQLMEFEFLDGTRSVGRLRQFGEQGALQIVLEHEEATRSVPLESAARIATLDEGKVRNRFDGRLSVGWSAASANDVSQISVNAGLTYRDELRMWDFTYDGSRSKTQETSSSKSQTLAIEQRRFLRDRWFWTGGGNIAMNDELGLELRLLLGGGAGRYFFETPHQMFFAALGLGVSHEEFVGGETLESLEGILRVSYDLFRFDTPEIDIATQLTVYPSLTISGRVRTSAGIQLRYEIINDLYYRLSYQHEYDSDPQTLDAVDSDWSLVTSLGYSF